MSPGSLEALALSVRVAVLATALCALLGITSSYGIELAFASPVAPMYAMTMLGIMIFVSSTLNDLGDVEGDRAAGRRTIPIVLGGTKTIRMAMVLVAGMSASSWVLYAAGGIWVVPAASTTLFAALVISRLAMIGRELGSNNMEHMRSQHKKIFPLHMVLQASLAAAGIAEGGGGGTLLLS